MSNNEMKIHLRKEMYPSISSYTVANIINFLFEGIFAMELYDVD